MLPPRLITDLEQSLAAEGDDALAQLGEGPFLLEIPTQSPRGPHASFVPTPDRQTAKFGSDQLLGLKRARGSDSARVFPLAHGAILGRGESCDLQLTEDEAISKEHARFSKLGSGWLVEDMGSENGTFVRGGKIRSKATPLESLDLVQTGGHRFTFATAEDLQALLSPVASTHAIPVARVLAELEALGSKRFLLRYTTPCLLLAHRRKGEQRPEFLPTVLYPLAGEEGPMTIGRTSETDIKLADKRVSKRHAQITRVPDTDQSELEDLGASNSTVAGGRKLGKGEKVRLSPWDPVDFGNAVWGLYHSPRSLVENLTELRRSLQ